MRDIVVVIICLTIFGLSMIVLQNNIKKENAFVICLEGGNRAIECKCAIEPEEGLCLKYYNK